MRNYIIGSRWMAEMFHDHPKLSKRAKSDCDYDVLIKYDNVKDKTTKEYFKGILPPGSKIDLHYIPLLWDILESQEYSSRQLQDVLFTLKASHVSFDDVHQEKTFLDLYYMSEYGCRIIEPLFFLLHKWWTQQFGEKWRADFTAESAQFFLDAVSRENVHDQLHEAVAHFDRPAFKFLQDPDQTTVWVCPNKFERTTELVRQRVVIEEAQTLALERFIIPGRSTNKTLCYHKMIKGLVDRLAPLWMTVYIINNLYYFLNFKQDYGNSYLSRNQNTSQQIS